MLKIDSMHSNSTTMKILNSKWLLYLTIASIYSITQFSLLLYIIFAAEIICFITSSVNQTKDTRIVSIIGVLSASIIMPDNYCILFAAILVFFNTVSKKINRNAIILLMISLAYCISNAVINAVPINNVIIWCIYFLPFPLLYCGVNRLFSSGIAIEPIVLVHVKRILLIQIVCVLLYAVSHIGAVVASNDMDWVTGTMGAYQANTLMVVSSFSLILLLSELRKGRKRLAFWCLLAGILMVSTTSVSYLVVFVFAYCLVMIFSLQVGIFERLALCAAMVAAAGIFVAISPQWVSSEMLKMTDQDYASQRFEKAVFYERTFIDLPNREGEGAFLFGTGIGQYSSRAALTCAGGYIEMYDNYFSGYESNERAYYLFDEDRDGGLASTADSSVIALQGELGICGLIVFMVIVLTLLKKSRSPYLRIAVIYFISLCFVDNIIEYAKFCAMFCLAVEMCACENRYSLSDAPNNANSLMSDPFPHPAKKQQMLLVSK